MRLSKLLALIPFFAFIENAGAVELAKTSSASSSLPVRAALSGQVFLRARGTRIPGGDFSRALALQRARLTIELEAGEVFRVLLEPDFAGQSADLADAFLDVKPMRELRLRAGQAKTPFGIFETTSRWRLPSTSRGMVSEIISERLGFGGRRIGASGEVRLREVPWKPDVEIGAFGDFSTDAGGDGAARLTLRPLKGGQLQLAGYHRAGAALDGLHGNAGAIGGVYDRGGGFFALEALLGHARLLRQDGTLSTQNATFLGARGIAAWNIELDDVFGVEPFAALEVLDPNLETTDDGGLDVRGGVSLRYEDLFRFTLEAESQSGQRGFVTSDLVVLTALLAVKVE